MNQMASAAIITSHERSIRAVHTIIFDHCAFITGAAPQSRRYPTPLESLKRWRTAAERSIRDSTCSRNVSAGLPVYHCAHASPSGETHISGLGCIHQLLIEQHRD